METSLATAGHRVETVANRVDWRDGHARGEPAPCDELGQPLTIGESRLAAQLALACREARGPFAGPVAELAERCLSAARR